MAQLAKGVKGIITQNENCLVLVDPNGLFDLLGGKVEQGELEWQTLYREIFEETNLRVEIVSPFSGWTFLKT